MELKSDCNLCEYNREILAENRHWIMVLNENQATLGRVYFILKRHETDVTLISEPEREALWPMLTAAKHALKELFAPDHYNFLFHMNAEPHVHMHLYPRYAETRSFAAETFTDTHYGRHYDPQEIRTLTTPIQTELAQAIQKALPLPNEERG